MCVKLSISFSTIPSAAVNNLSSKCPQSAAVTESSSRIHAVPIQSACAISSVIVQYLGPLDLNLSKLIDLVEN